MDIFQDGDESPLLSYNETIDEERVLSGDWIDDKLPFVKEIKRQVKTPSNAPPSKTPRKPLETNKAKKEKEETHPPVQKEVITDKSPKEPDILVNKETVPAKEKELSIQKPSTSISLKEPLKNKSVIEQMAKTIMEEKSQQVEKAKEIKPVASKEAIAQPSEHKQVTGPPNILAKTEEELFLLNFFGSIQPKALKALKILIEKKQQIAKVEMTNYLQLSQSKTETVIRGVSTGMEKMQASINQVIDMLGQDRTERQKELAKIPTETPAEVTKATFFKAATSMARFLRASIFKLGSQVPVKSVQDYLVDDNNHTRIASVLYKKGGNLDMGTVREFWITQGYPLVSRTEKKSEN